MGKRQWAMTLIGLSALCLPRIAMAVTHSVTAQMQFSDSGYAQTISGVDFGVIPARYPAAYRLDPNANTLMIGGSPGQMVDVAIDNYVSDHGVTPSHALCAYNGQRVIPCRMNLPPQPQARLLSIGMEVMLDRRLARSAAPQFDVKVNYH